MEKNKVKTEKVFFKKINAYLRTSAHLGYRTANEKFLEW